MTLKIISNKRGWLVIRLLGNGKTIVKRISTTELNNTLRRYNAHVEA